MNLFVTCAFIGGFIMIFGLISAKMREKLCISEAPLAVILGIILGPACLSFLTFESLAQQESWVLNICRIVIDIQVMTVAVGLPSRFVWDEWRSLLTMLLLGMGFMWIVSAALVEALVPGMDILTALMIASCFTPTDPVLSNAIVQGHYAERHVRSGLRHLIAAESAANDGLGYPFLFIAVYCMKLGGAEGAKEWVLQAVLRGVLLSIAIGTVLGLLGRFLLKQCYKRKMIDAESLHIASFGIALFLLGVVSLVFSDDLLACFAAGCALSWDDWYKQNTNRVYFSEILDPFLNIIIFTLIGATMPWQAFADLMIWRLVVLAILVLLLRRLPSTLILYKITPAIYDWREALFAGWFGPIGVGAIFYYAIAAENFEHDGPFAYAREMLYPVVYFIVLASVIVHGFSIPVYIGYQFLRGSHGDTDTEAKPPADSASDILDAEMTLNGETLISAPRPIANEGGNEEVEMKKEMKVSSLQTIVEKVRDDTANSGTAIDLPQHRVINMEACPEKNIDTGRPT